MSAKNLSVLMINIYNIWPNNDLTGMVQVNMTVSHKLN